MATTTRLRKGTFQHVESELYAYPDTKKAIIQLRTEILYGGSGAVDENVGGGRSSLPGDPTGRRATLLVTHKLLTSMEEVVEAIETVYDHLQPECKRLVELRYWSRPQMLTWDGIALQIGVSRRQAINWRNTIITSIANRLGWQ